MAIEQAYARLVRRYQSEIADQMWRFSRQVSVAEELVQEVFVEAYFSLAKFRGQSPLLHWLRRIATRVGYRYWKHEARRGPGRLPWRLGAWSANPRRNPGRKKPEQSCIRFWLSCRREIGWC